MKLESLKLAMVREVNLNLRIGDFESLKILEILEILETLEFDLSLFFGVLVNRMIN